MDLSLPFIDADSVGGLSEQVNDLRKRLTTALVPAVATDITQVATDTTLSIGTQRVVMVSASSAPFTVYLPDARLMNTNSVFFKKTDATANAVTVSTVESQTIDGSATTLSLTTQNQSVWLLSDSTTWWVLSTYP